VAAFDDVEPTGFVDDGGTDPVGGEGDEREGEEAVGGGEGGDDGAEEFVVGGDLSIGRKGDI
jgi:hypothetical protein